MHEIGIKSVRQFVLQWNNSFPLDLWWRKKYNIPFNSKSHRQSNFIDQLIEFIEDKMLREETEKKEKYQPGKLNWMKPKKYTDEEVKELFDQIDLDKI